MGYKETQKDQVSPGNGSLHEIGYQKYTDLQAPTRCHSACI